MKAKALRIVFMGTPDFAVGVLDKLVQNNYTIVAVVTAVDKPAGRGKKLQASSVKKYALEKDIPVLQPKNLKDIDFVNELKSFKADLQIVVAFRMLPKVVWNSSVYGTFNLHASLLPAYRGAAPINWAIINGETETGVTTFFIDEKIDTGAILLQRHVAISATETAGTLHDKLMEKGGRLVLKTVNLIAKQDFKTTKQPAIAPSNAPKLYKDNCLVNWQEPLKTVYDKIRGLSPYPAAWCKFISNNEEFSMKFYHTHTDYCKHTDEIGQIITTKKSIKVALKDGYLILDEIQLSGKRKMDAISLLNGFHFSINARML